MERYIAYEIADDTVNDLDYLLDFVGRMTDYGEPELVYLLQRLASLNHKSQPKSHRRTSVTNESWGRAACQKRRLQKLKGQKPYYKNLLRLTKREVCELIAMCDFLRPDGRCNTRATATCRKFDGFQTRTIM
ncbi:hypothetical protein FOXB_00010 [Fusarium oxysporum f. sp. conglutinans Fo5176]|uniref:Uncharacterized protein n=2 Tax=Fusarium oxysporum (strain Fo5176) TaxID=660025 RepID=F9F0T6_FUSOF|nr:hypothetical protein FOXB_00010 [Fusarium oxysporum f. sp. conglutinans Fo5176]